MEGGYNEIVALLKKVVLSRIWEVDHIWMDLFRIRKKRGAEPKEVCRLTESVWKPHKSKDLTFLHGSYAQLFCSTPKNNFSRDQQKYFSKKVQKSGKNRKFQWKINIDFSLKFSIFSGFLHFFGEIFLLISRKIIFWSWTKKLSIASM